MRTMGHRYSRAPLPLKWALYSLTTGFPSLCRGFEEWAVRTSAGVIAQPSPVASAPWRGNVATKVRGSECPGCLRKLDTLQPAGTPTGGLFVFWQATSVFQHLQILGFFTHLIGNASPDVNVSSSRFRQFANSVVQLHVNKMSHHQ